MRKLNFKLHKKGLTALALGLILVIVTATVVPTVCLATTPQVQAYVNSLTGEVRITSADSFSVTKSLGLSPTWKSVIWGTVGPQGPTGATGPAGPAGTTVNYRAGNASIAQSTNHVHVTISAMPYANYSVSALISNSPNFGSSRYLQVSAKSTTEFTITLRDHDGGTQNAPTGGVTFDWVAIARN